MISGLRAKLFFIVLAVCSVSIALTLILFIRGYGITYSADRLSLDALIKEVKEKNPEILAAKKRWEAALARIPQAKSLENPTVSFEFEKIPRNTMQFNNVMPEDRMLSLSQFIPLFGKLSLKGKIAVVDAQMAAGEYKDKELEVINQIKNAYYDLFMNYKEIALDKESLGLLEGIARVAEAGYAVGDISQEGVFKIHLEIARLNNNILNLQKEKEAKEARVNALLNRKGIYPLAEPDLSEETSFNMDAKTLYQAALLNQPELLIFSYAVEKNKYVKSLAKKSIFPDLMAQLTLRGITSGTTGPWDLMMGFSVPLWYWTKQRYEIREAIFNLEQAEAAYEAMKNKAYSRVKDLSAKIEIAKNKIKLYRTSLIPVLESSIESSLAGFRSGKGDFMMLLDSQRMLIEEKMNYYTALVEYNMAVVDLEREVGLNLTEVGK